MVSECSSLSTGAPASVVVGLTCGSVTAIPPRELRCRLPGESAGKHAVAITLGSYRRPLVIVLVGRRVSTMMAAAGWRCWHDGRMGQGSQESHDLDRKLSRPEASHAVTGVGWRLVQSGESLSQ